MPGLELKVWGASLAVALAVVSTSACSAASPAPEAPARTGGASTDASPSAGTGSPIYLLVGNQTYSANVFQWRLGATDAKQITYNKSQYGISAIDGSRSGIVVANAATGADHLAELANDKLVPIRLPRQSRIGAPQISATGSLLFQGVRFLPDKSYLYTVAVRSRVASGAVRNLIVRKTPFASATWTNVAGQIAVLNSRPHRKRFSIEVMSSSGKKLRSIAGDAGSFLFNMSTSPTSPLASLTNAKGYSVLVNLQTSRIRPIAAGWSTLCWRPNGQDVLATNGSALGLVSARRPRQAPRVVGHFAGANVYGCAWPGGR